MAKKINTKDRIINTTIEIIGTRGIKEASAGNISQEGGFTKSNIFYYFDSTDQLLLAALDKSIKEISPILKRDFKNYKSLEEYLNESIIILIEDRDKVLYLKLILSFAHQANYLTNILDNLRKILIDDLCQVLVDSIEYFKSRDMEGEEVESIASLIMTTFNGLGLLLLIDGSNHKFIRNWKLQSKLINSFI